MLGPDGITRTMALGTERMARRLSDALPGGEHPLRAALWESSGRCSRRGWPNCTAMRS